MKNSHDCLSKQRKWLPVIISSSDKATMWFLRDVWSLIARDFELVKFLISFNYLLCWANLDQIKIWSVVFIWLWAYRRFSEKLKQKLSFWIGFFRVRFECWSRVIRITAFDRKSSVVLMKNIHFFRRKLSALKFGKQEKLLFLFNNSFLFLKQSSYISLSQEMSEMFQKIGNFCLW